MYVCVVAICCLYSHMEEQPCRIKCVEFKLKIKLVKSIWFIKYINVPLLKILHHVAFIIEVYTLICDVKSLLLLPIFAKIM